MEIYRYIVIIILVSLCSLSCSQSTILQKVSDKYWFEEDHFAGASLTIYQTSNGLTKAIRQIHGSGVAVIKSEIYDVENSYNSLLLKNGIDLQTSESISDKSYYYDLERKLLNRFNGAHNVSIISKDRIKIYTWTRDYYSTARINFELLKKIEIGENEIYSPEEIEKIIIESN